MLLNKLIRHQRKCAFCILVVMAVEAVAPSVSLALTSGPAQPEMQGFEPIGASNMVDLFSGDFTYSIPLMDVGGYPLNLNYHSGSSPDDEASWVGFGWSLTPGVVNRQLRGLPDDFDGAETVKKQQSYKDDITFGVNGTVKAEALGVPLDASLNAGISYDSYTGIGTTLGVNAGINIADAFSSDPNYNEGTTSDIRVGGTLGLTTSSVNGSSLAANVDISRDAQEHSDHEAMSIGFNYNSRQGLQGLTLGTSFRPGTLTGPKNLPSATYGGSTFISFVGPTYMPSVNVPFTNSLYSLSVDGGGELLGFYGGVGFGGFYGDRFIAGSDKTKYSPAYGFLNLEKGMNNPYALMDYNLEKDIPYSPEVQYLQVPIPTNDLFSATSQAGTGQYTIKRGEPGILFDPQMLAGGGNTSLGVELGFGDAFDVGADVYLQSSTNETGKWTGNNTFAQYGDFNNQLPYNTSTEHAYFKKMGEPVIVDSVYAHSIYGDSAVNVQLAQTGTTETALNALQLSNGATTRLATPLGRKVREHRIEPMSYLTASEATLGGLDKTINSYQPGQVYTAGCSWGGVTAISRVGGYRAAHHLSQLTTIGKDGQRLVYGIPVYNTSQVEATFNVNGDTSYWKEGIIPYNASTDDVVTNSNGTTGYFSKTTVPPYSTSFLLTGMLSPDYVDVTGDGITDDDLGTAVKFNYTKMDSLYRWRTPIDRGQANYNPNMLSDVHDDNANYTYGTKELWYMHSVESKTMVALFIMENRKDGFGTYDSTGGVDTAVHQQLLKEIRLYSKSDINKAGGNLANVTPIKVAHFVYCYSLMPGIPNSVNDTTGKLTLKEVYFTFGNNQKGAMSPYKFTYYSEGIPFTYHHQQYDRWGQYKDPASNPSGMNSAEFPFTIQDTSITNDFASRWQLQTITLPSGGVITVHYESDDYAYVQNQRACQMFQIAGINTIGGNTGVTNAASRLLITLPQPVSSQQDLMFRYFQNMPYLFFKCMLRLDDAGHNEFVPGYARIAAVNLINSTTAAITLVPDQVSGVGNVNPIANAGWQFIRANLPQYAYPGSNNLYNPGGPVEQAIESLMTAITNLGELEPNYFPQMAVRDLWSDLMDLSHSYVRLCSPNFTKLGGGARVSRLDISDQWGTMTGTSDAKTATYTQTYNYTTTTQDENGAAITISSGVASYEPLVGGEENPFHQPVFYAQNSILQLDRDYYIEQPFGEALFPAPTVGYSKVTVTSLDVGSQQGSAGMTVSEFYTAKDFPTRTSNTPLQKLYGQNSAILHLLFSEIAHSVGLSQGFVVENNDMHGKPKLEAVYNRSGELIASTEYDYKTLNPTAETQDLDNKVNLVSSNGQISSGLLNQDVQYFTFMRDARSDLEGHRLQTSGGAFDLAFFVLGFLFPGPGMNYDRRDLRSSSTIKVVHNFGVLDKVIKTINGSSITTSNELWDSQTGDVVLTKSQNEFDDPLYNLTLPAYWMYDGMGAAYQNDGTYLEGFTADGTTGIIGSKFTPFLAQGDEVVDLSTNSGTIHWVTNSDGNLRLINRDGTPGPTFMTYARVIRSGRRNILSGATSTFVSLIDPVAGGRLNLSYATKILDAKASEYNQIWNVPTAYCPYQCPSGYSMSPDGTTCYQVIPATLNATTGCTTLCDGDHTTDYSAAGYRVYDGNGNIVVSINNSNPWWVGGVCASGQTDVVNNTVKAASLAKATTVSAPTKSDSATFASNIATKSKLSVNAQPSDPGGGNPPNCGMPDTARDGKWCGPLNRCGVWSCQGYSGSDRLPTNTFLTITRCITVPTTGTYYLGVGGDNELVFTIDGVTVTPAALANGQQTDNYIVWCFIPVTMTAGPHTITMTGANTGSYATMGAEIYNNTLAQIEAATSYTNLNLIFSTKDLIGQQLNNSAYSCPAGYTLTGSCSGDTIPSCQSVLPAQWQINPYVKGFLGNWRTVRSYVFQTDRENRVALPAKTLPGATNIRTSGAYASFVPYWSNSGDTWTKSTDPRWVMKEEATGFSQKGDGIESKDALGNYSSALYGYLQSLPVAVATNARYREIAYDGFEDYGFLLNCSTPSCPFYHFSFYPDLAISGIALDSLTVHSGRYSLALRGTSVNISRTIYPDSDTLPFLLDAKDYYKINANQWEQGFSPFAGKKYILSLWINDGLPHKATTTASITVNGASLINGSMNFPVVEGWKKIEVPFTIPAGNSSFSLTIQPSGTLYVDDIRIHPFDAEMKTFAFDATSQRVMAELDENNFATFYEYDDEGILIRVKKETERGIMTLKETRSSFKYQPKK